MLSTLRCSFPKADIAEGAQQSDTPEVGDADKTVIRPISVKVYFVDMMLAVTIDRNW